jgi:hypothetical protein
MLLEEMLVIDAATLYPRYNRGGSLYALDIIDGATIKPLKTREEARADLGLAPAAGAAAQSLTGCCVCRRRTPRERRPQRFRGLEQKENILLTAYAGRRIVIYSGRSGGGDQPLPFPAPSENFVRAAPFHRA